ncbi:hypothetical protein [Parahaliea mediterranea]|uniref:Uncharacterized protein n=1 Tax=Parahaliea mediterranea TaxID=651086 RepID=A0A939IMW2_9GAMM|nr:hypothetical protein [Parahaliea mediterranea]MBN7797417.1 hypothetical protein [Parahaliea mediterranea]
MRAVSETLPGVGGGKTNNVLKRRYKRPALMALLLLAVYLLLRWVPLEAAEGQEGGIRLELVLLWCLGGVVTLVFLAIAGRRS